MPGHPYPDFIATYRFVNCYYMQGCSNVHGVVNGVRDVTAIGVRAECTYVIVQL